MHPDQMESTVGDMTSVPKINILFVYYEPFPSGQSTHVFSIITHLDQSKFAPFLIIPSNFQKYSARHELENIKVIPLVMNKLFWPLGSIRKFISTIKENDIKIVHIHSQEASFIARILAKMAGVKQIIYTPQTIDIHNKKIYGLYKIFEFLFSENHNKNNFSQSKGL